MHRILLGYRLFIGLMLLTSCAPDSSKETQKLATKTTSLNTELGFLKHEQTNYDIEMRLIEGKLTSQEAQIADLRDDLLSQQKTSKQLVTNKLSELDTKIAQIEKGQVAIIEDVRQIKTHSNDLSATIQQYRKKLMDFESVIEKQNRNIANLESALNSLTTIMERNAKPVVNAERPAKVVPGIDKSSSSNDVSSTTSTAAVDSNLQKYVVKQGDTLQKIAKSNNVSVQDLKRYNGLEKDQIFIGQELKIPTK